MPSPPRFHPSPLVPSVLSTRACAQDCSTGPLGGGATTLAKRRFANSRTLRKLNMKRTADMAARATGVVGAMLEAATAKGAPLARTAASKSPLEARSEEHTSELQSLMRISYAVSCLKKKKNTDIKQGV